MKSLRSLLAAFGLAVVGTASFYALTAVDRPGSLGMPRARDGRGRSGREGPRAAAPWAFCDQALQAGDKSGSWGCLNGDQTGTGTVAFASVGSPTTGGGSSCVSAAYSNIAAATPSYFRSQVIAAPAGDFSVCALVLPTSTWDSSGLWAHSAGGGTYSFTQETTGGLFKQFFSAGGSFNSATAATTFPAIGTNPVMGCMTYKASTTTSTVYIAGHLLGSGATATMSSPGSARYYLGNDGLGATFTLTGRFFGGFVTEKTLTAADVGRISHAANCSRVAWLGDSLSTYPTPPPTQVQAVTGVPIDSYAQVGARFNTGASPLGCTSQWSASNGDLMARKVLVECGVNDIVAAETGAALWAEMQPWLEARIAAGILVAPITINPFKNYASWSAGKEIERDAFNASLVAWCATHTATAHCINTTASSASGGLASPADNDALDATYDFGDGLHLNPAGNIRFSTLIIASW